MLKTHLHSIIGLAGVADDEREIAQSLGRRFEIPMILMAIWIIIQWYAEERGMLSGAIVFLADWVIWLFFVVETTVLTYFVKDKYRYLRNNWINLLIIFMGIPVVAGLSNYAGALRSLRLLLMFAILLNISDTIRQVLSRNHLGMTLLVSFIIIIVGGILIAGIDPAIDSVGEGLWWAWVTITTVGYGDVVPVSLAGKLFGAFLILMGVALFSLLTANFSAFFISREEGAEKRIELEMMEKLDRIEKRLEKLESLCKKNQ